MSGSELQTTATEGHRATGIRHLQLQNAVRCLKEGSLTLFVWHRLQHLQLQGLFIESERQDDGRRPLLEPQLLAYAGRRHVQVKVVGVEHDGAIQGVDEQALGGGGRPAAT